MKIFKTRPADIGRPSAKHVKVLLCLSGGCILGCLASVPWLAVKPCSKPSQTQSNLIARAMEACTAHCVVTSTGRKADKAYDILYVSQSRLDEMAPHLKDELQNYRTEVLEAATNAFENALDAPYTVIVACYFLELLEDDSCLPQAKSALNRLPPEIPYAELRELLVTYPGALKYRLRGPQCAVAAIKRWIINTERIKNSKS